MSGRTRPYIDENYTEMMQRLRESLPPEESREQQIQRWRQSSGPSQPLLNFFGDSFSAGTSTNFIRYTTAKGLELSGDLTFGPGGNIIISGSIGTKSGPLISFDSVNNDLLVTGVDHVAFGTSTPEGFFLLRKDQNTLTLSTVENATNDTGAWAGFNVKGGATELTSYALSANYTSVLQYQASSVLIEANINASGGMIFSMVGQHPFKWFQNGSLSMALESDGNMNFGGTIEAPSIGADTDNSVVILNSSGLFKTDEIDSRVWGSSLLDGSNGVDNRVATFVDANSLNGETNLTFDGSILAINEKAGITSIGGTAIKVLNITGFTSVEGEVVETSSDTDIAAVIAGSNSIDAIGVVYESGIANFEEMWIVVGGMAKVLADGNGYSRHDRVVTSVIAGRVVANNNPSIAVHFQEIGHVLDSASADSLGLVALHFL